MSYYVSSYPVTSSAITSVTASTAATQLIARNDNREKFILSLTGSTTAYVGLGFTPTSASFTVYMQTGDVFSDSSWKGSISVIFASQSNSTVLCATDINRP